MLQQRSRAVLAIHMPRPETRSTYTVVLSVEVENLFPGASSTTPGSLAYHLEVERVDVSINRTGASASFIGWL